MSIEIVEIRSSSDEPSIVSINQGPSGPPNILTIGTVESGASAFANITGSSPSQELNLVLPKGDQGIQGDRAGLKYRFDTSTSPGAPSPGHLRFNSSTLSDVTRISIRDTDFDGTSTSALLELIDDSTSAIKARVVIRSNSNSDTSHFNFLVTSVTDEGNHHHINGTYVSGSAFDSNEIVAFDFFVTGDKGDTGSSGATAVLTGYVSGAGTVLATDTVIQAVGKLNGNDELKAPIASLYPYIGGKLLTYLDEEAAIADPLISAGDIYRKSAGGVDYVNPDNVPSLDLRFATDKTLTARRGPTPTFTRGSGATYIGSDGLIHGIDTSTTSNSISAASKTFTLAATAGQDQLWRAGDAVEASNGSNIMTGTVTSYDATTQSLVCNMTTASGSGTYTSWRIGYRGPRFDHNPTSPFACRGLLIEEGRTNLAVRSDDFGASEWNQQGNTRNLTVSANNTASPSGATDADLLTVGATTTTYQVVQRLPAVSGTLTSGTAYTVSCYFKPNQVTRVSIWAGNTLTLPADAIFDLTGSGSVVLATAGTASIQQVGNGWYRCIITGTAGATSDTTLRIGPASGTSRNYVGNSVDSFWAWGAQLEAGSFPTSYIPTTTGTLARSADVCSIANTASFWNSDQFTLFGNANFPNPAHDAYAANFSITSGFFGVRRPNTNTATAIIRSLGVNADISLGTFVTGTMRMAVAHSSGQQAAAFNGGSATQASSAFSPSLNPALNIGYSGTAGYINGHIAAIRYYRKRLPNAKLQSLTV